jgi:DNA repair protein RadB
MVKKRQPKISAGSFELNKFLFGGYETDIITTLYGPGASGKTNLALIVATSQARKGNKVIYIDTEGGFSIDRVHQLVYKNEEEYETTLRNIILLNPTNFQEQEDAFENIAKHLKKGGISLIVVDSIAMLYRLELADAIQTKEDEKIKAVNRKLARQLKYLNEVARKQHIPVVVTNQVYSEFVSDEELKERNYEKQVSMVGGDLLKYWSKCLIELQNFSGKRKVILQKHRSLPKKELAFEITNGGIKKKGLF